MAFVPILSTGSQKLLDILDEARSLDDLIGTAGFHALRGMPQRHALVGQQELAHHVWLGEAAAIAVDLEDYH